MSAMSLPNSPTSEKPGSANNLPLFEAIRQQARQWLTKAQEKPDPNLDPVYQLMLWGLDRGLGPASPSYREQLRASVEYLAHQLENPNDGLEYLLQLADSQEPRVSPNQLAQAKNPLQASQVLLEALDSAMSADPKAEGWPPVYPKAESN